MTDNESKLLTTYGIKVEGNDVWSIGDSDTSEVDYEKYKSVKNRSLNKAKKAKNDDFYTQLSDIEAELKHYEDKFRGKVIYLPCDVAHKGESGESVVSNFWVYFHLNFQRLGLKKLIATNIDQMRVEAPMNEGTYKAFIYENTNAEYSGLDNDTTKFTRVEEIAGNGDFRSEACRQLMHEADIIVTNPPFSLFREFVAQIMELRKQFIVWGRKDCINYVDFGKHFIKGEVFLGFTYASHSKFIVPGGDLKEVGTVTYTNLETHLKPKPYPLTCSYSPREYQKYPHYDAINVDSADEIPNDYFKPIGVPVTFLKYLSPEQFDLLDARQFATSEKLKKKSEIIISHELINGKSCYARILIKRKTIPVELEFLQSFVDGVAMTLEEVTDAFMDYSGDLFSTFFTNCRSELQSAKRDRNEYQILKSDNELEINCGSGYKILLGIVDATHLTYTKLVKPEKEGA